MLSAAYITAGQIKLKQQFIVSFLTKLQANSFTNADISGIYDLLEDATSYQAFVDNLTALLETKNTALQTEFDNL